MDETERDSSGSPPYDLFSPNPPAIIEYVQPGEYLMHPPLPVELLVEEEEEEEKKKKKKKEPRRSPRKKKPVKYVPYKSPKKKTRDETKGR